MAKAKQRVLAQCADYNGYKNILFMMDADDFRLTDERFSANYTVIDTGAYTHRTRTLVADGRTFTVLRDWSLIEQAA